jgi:hypothetical protein
MYTDLKMYFIQQHPTYYEYKVTQRGFDLYAEYNAWHGGRVRATITREYNDYYYTISCGESFAVNVTHKSSVVIRSFQEFMKCGRPQCITE